MFLLDFVLSIRKRYPCVRFVLIYKRKYVKLAYWMYLNSAGDVLPLDQDLKCRRDYMRLVTYFKTGLWGLILRALFTLGYVLFDSSLMIVFLLASCILLIRVNCCFSTTSPTL